MSSYIDSITKILEDFDNNESVEHSLLDFDSYLAHTPTKASPKRPETLSEHLDLVQGYFKRLVEAHSLDVVIDKLILEYLYKINGDATKLAGFIKRIFVHSVCYHDHGKINENFQADQKKMNNPKFRGKENPANGIGTQHSTLSAFIFLCHKIEEASRKFSGKDQILAISSVVLHSYGIYKHHGKYLEDDYIRKIVSNNQSVEKLKDYLKLFKTDYDSSRITASLLNLGIVLEKISFTDYAKSFSLYQLLRLNFSLLTASDYLATNEYMNQDRITDFGTFSKERITKMVQRIQTEDWLDKECRKRNFNKNIYKELNTLSLEKPTTKNNVNLNLLRQQMAIEAIRNTRKNIDERIFYLEAPTGGGKTNISMLVSLELLNANSDLNKVFYVFPFTTLIDQSYKNIRESLDLSENEIVALHSKNSILKDNEKDDDYGDKRKNHLSHLFLNFPFCFLSHVRFFNLLVTNEKEQNYILHKLANSIVVIDELQSYSPKHWDKVIFFIQEYARTYNIRFIIMSATLPKINKLNLEVPVQNIVYLLPNAREDYFQNVNFKDRVTFDFSLSEQKIELDELAEKVLKESRLYAEKDFGALKPKGSVFTIVEFIFKKSATNFYMEMERLNINFFNEVFVLSGTILQHRRQHIINYIKRKENRDNKILLITTQVVEAGVDIDMDLGFKDKSLLDSDEQLAGRINRNVNKRDCKLFLFNYNRESVIYGDDLRYKMTKAQISKKEEQLILETKNFDLLYDKVIAFKDERNSNQNFHGFQHYHDLIENLKFRSISEEFQLIDKENISCFIPLNVPIKIEGEDETNNENIFSAGELNFLSTFGLQPSKANEIEGDAVFDLYIQLINSETPNFEVRLDMKILQSILSKFVFSVFKTTNFETRIVEFADMEKSGYGYYYITHWQDFYDEIKGINDTHFNSVENQFL